MSVFGVICGPSLAYAFPMPKKPEVSAAFAPGSLLCLNENGEVAFNVPDKSPKAIRAQIRNLKNQMLAGLPNEAEQPEHTLIDGVYTRILRIPKGQVLIGKIHKKECVNIVAKGDISVLTEHGSGRIKAGHVAVSGPGIQKIGYAHEDTIFINVFRTDLTDIAQIEQEISSEDDSEKEQV
jgi:hypothetical protein